MHERRIWIWQHLLFSGYRLWYIFFGIVLIWGFVSKNWLLVGLALLLLMLFGMLELWYHLLPLAITAKANIRERRAYIGDVVTLDIEITNHLPFTIPWLQVACAVPRNLEPINGPSKAGIVSKDRIVFDELVLGPNQHLKYQRQLFCASRGAYESRLITVTTSDPFGWLTRESEHYYRGNELLIYPFVTALEELEFAAQRPFGEFITTRRLTVDPLRLAGVRQYQAGDDPRIIHWNASARMGELYSKIFEPGGTYRFLVFINVNADASYQSFIDDDVLDWHVTIAASLVHWALDEDYAVGILANAEFPPQIITEGDEEDTQNTAEEEDMNLVWLPPNTQDDQQEMIFTALTRIEPIAGLPLEDVIHLYQQAFLSGSTVVCISNTAALRTRTVDALVELRQKGIHTHLVLSGTTEERLHIPTYDIPVYRIGGKEKWHALLDKARKKAQDDSQQEIWQIEHGQGEQ